MSASANGARLAALTKELLVRWQHTREYWRDNKAREFEQRYLLELDGYQERQSSSGIIVSTGAGFAKAGFIPIVDTFGQFGVTKGNLPLTMAALSQAPLIAIFSHVGFQDAADGASHQATTYFAATSAIPHTTVIACSCSDEAEALMYQAIQRCAQAPKV